MWMKFHVCERFLSFFCVDSFEEFSLMGLSNLMRLKFSAWFSIFIFQHFMKNKNTAPNNPPMVYKILKENLLPLRLENCQRLPVINCSNWWIKSRVDQTLKETSSRFWRKRTEQSSQTKKNECRPVASIEATEAVTKLGRTFPCGTIG